MATFHVRIELAPQILRYNVSHKGPISLPFHVQVDNTLFPDPDWDDFAVVILGSWIEQIMTLTQHKDISTVLYFMDGPYRINVRQALDCLVIKCIVQRIKQEVIARETVDSRQMLEEVMRAAKQLLEALRENLIWDRDCDKLESLLYRREKESGAE